MRHTFPQPDLFIAATAISGHTSLRELQRYIEEANQVVLAEAAILRMTEHARNARVATGRENSG